MQNIIVYNFQASQESSIAYVHYRTRLVLLGKGREREKERRRESYIIDINDAIYKIFHRLGSPWRRNLLSIAIRELVIVINISLFLSTIPFYRVTPLRGKSPTSRSRTTSQRNNGRFELTTSAR